MLLGDRSGVDECKWTEAESGQDCSDLYVGLPLRLMWTLQLVQNLVARLITGVNKFQHIFPTLATIHWLPIRFHINFKVMIITFKALNGLGPRYLSECLLPARSVCNNHSSQAGQLRAFTQKETQSPEGMNKKPGLLGCRPLRLWNYLPMEIHLAPTLDGFKLALKIWLLCQAFPEH